MERVSAHPPVRVPGTAVFMTAQPQGTPPALAHNLRHNKVLHEHVVVLTGGHRAVPHVPPERRTDVRSLGAGVFYVVVSMGSWKTRTFRRHWPSPAGRASRWIPTMSPTSSAAKRSSSQSGRAWRLAREAVRPDDAECRPGDGVLPPSPRAGRGAGRAGRNVAAVARARLSVATVRG